MLNKAKKQYISIPELAKEIGISRVAVFNKVKNGQIPAEKIGRNYAIRVENVEHLMPGKTVILTEVKKKEINKAVERVVKDYGEALKLLGKE